MSTLPLDLVRPSLCAQDARAVDPRVHVLAQMRDAVFSCAEHPDLFSRGWNAGMQQAIGLLFPLPVPIYSCRFPTDGVSRGLRECHCGKRVCTGCSRG